MNVLMVNPVHPSTPHISAVRAWRFAEELANRGHEIMFLCAAAGQERGFGSAGTMVRKDKSPVLVECYGGASVAFASDTFPSVARKAVTAWRMLRHGGNLGGWADNAVSTARRLSATFRPDVAWTTFGKMEAVFVARRVARSLRCPWVLDIKDNWELFVPRGLRHVMVERTSGWAALTANSCFTQDKAHKWQRDDATVVYSGIDDAFFPEVRLNGSDSFHINLVGSLYFEEQLSAFLAGVSQWARTLKQESERDRVRLRYLGGDTDMFSKVSRREDSGIAVESLGYQTVTELARHCLDGAVNAYISNPYTFHHKLLELLACGRPVMAFPGESAESHSLARQTSGDLRTPATAEGVAAELARVYKQWRAGTAPLSASTFIHTFDWASQAVILERVLQAAVKGAKTHDG